MKLEKEIMPKRKYLCKNPNNNPKCRGEISFNSWKYGSGLCRSCSLKKMWKNPEVRNKITKTMKGNNRALKHGKYCKNIEYHCIDCGKLIWNGSIKCNKCKRIGTKWSKEIRDKIGKGNKNKIVTKKSREKISEANKGKIISEEHRKNLSLALGGTGISGENAIYSEAFSRELKLKIRKRDNFKCQISGMTEEEHIKKFEKALTVHHIDYDKKNCKEDNLITLSNIWNSKVNKLSEREYWTKYFKDIIKEKSCFVS